MKLLIALLFIVALVPHQAQAADSDFFNAKTLAETQGAYSPHNGYDRWVYADSEVTVSWLDRGADWVVIVRVDGEVVARWEYIPTPGNLTTVVFVSGSWQAYIAGLL